MDEMCVLLQWKIGEQVIQVWNKIHKWFILLTRIMCYLSKSKIKKLQVWLCTEIKLFYSFTCWRVMRRENRKSQYKTINRLPRVLKYLEQHSTLWLSYRHCSECNAPTGKGISQLFFPWDRYQSSSVLEQDELIRTNLVPISILCGAFSILLYKSFDSCHNSKAAKEPNNEQLRGF